METGTMLGVGSLLVSAVVAYTSLKRGNIDDRSGTNAQLQALNKTYREEIERLEAKMDESEKECLGRVAEMQKQLDSAQRMTMQQFVRINDLEWQLSQQGPKNG